MRSRLRSWKCGYGQAEDDWSPPATSDSSGSLTFSDTSGHLEKPPCPWHGGGAPNLTTLP